METNQLSQEQLLKEFSKLYKLPKIGDKVNIKATRSLKVYSKKENLFFQLINTDYTTFHSMILHSMMTNVIGRLCGDKESRQNTLNLPKNVKYISPTCEVLNVTIEETINHVGEPAYAPIIEVQLKGSNKEEYNIQGWCSLGGYWNVVSPIK